MQRLSAFRKHFAKHWLYYRYALIETRIDVVNSTWANAILFGECVLNIRHLLATFKHFGVFQIKRNVLFIFRSDAAFLQHLKPACTKNR